MSRFSSSGTKERSSRSLSMMDRLSFGAEGSKRLSTSSTSSNRTSTRYGFEADEPGATRPARILYRNYFDSETIPPSEVTMQANGCTLRVLKLDPAVTDVRASLVRWKKYKADIKLGQGQLHIALKSKKISKMPKNDPAGSQFGGNGDILWSFEVGAIKNVAYKRRGAKDFAISFVNDQRLLNILLDNAESAESWIIAIFAEVRVQASIFQSCLEEVLTPTWKKLLRNPELNVEQDEMNQLTLSDEEQRELLLPDKDETIADTCLREEVDLWTLCRGSDHPDTSDACERLSIWLKRNMRHEESAYWLAAAQEGRKLYGFRVKSEISDSVHNAQGTALVKSIIDELRNPSGHGANSNLDQVFVARSINSKIDVKARKEIVMNKLRSGTDRKGKSEVQLVGKGKKKEVGVSTSATAESNGGEVQPHDEFEDLI